MLNSAVNLWSSMVTKVVMYSRGYCKFFRPTWVWDSSNTWLETRSLKEEAIVLLHPMNRLQGHSGQIFMDKCRQFKEHPSFNLRLPSLQPWSLYLKAWHANVLSRGSECLSDHPRWMFKKNSMEFFVGLQSYLYYCYSGCTLKSHDHLLFPECSMVTCSFQNVLWSPDLVTWLWLTQSLSCLLLRCILGCLKCVGNLFPTRGSHNTALCSVGTFLQQIAQPLYYAAISSYTSVYNS